MGLLRRLGGALLLLGCPTDGAVHWSAARCPNASTWGSVERSCQEPSPPHGGDVDTVVSLFFQVELLQNETIGSITCRTKDAVVCNRAWLPHESGSSGSCWFLLPAGSSYECSGEGTIHVIGANTAPLRSKLLDAAHSAAIPGLAGAAAAGSVARHSAGSADEWVSLSWRLASSSAARAPLRSFTCAAGGIMVCSFSANTTAASDPASASAQSQRGGSCAFLLPAESSLTCTMGEEGGVDWVSATATPLRQSVYGKTAAALPANYTCPDPPTPMYPDGRKGNPCDCGWINPYTDRDIVVAINALSVDDGYNNFFCYAGVQQASFGVDSSNRNDGGSSYFILGAGEQLTCEMQYGTLAWPSVSVISMEGSIFPQPSQQPSLALPSAATDAGVQRGVGAPKSRRPQPELRRLWREWRVAHSKRYASAEEEGQRFENFGRSVSLADTHDFVGGRRSAAAAKGSDYNALADLSLDEFSEKYRGCSLSVPEEEAARSRAPAELLTQQEIDDAPLAVNWTSRGAVSKVKNQAHCGGCWSFSATGSMESAWFLATQRAASDGKGTMQTLSEQSLISCESDCSGCGGGFPSRAMDWAAYYGIDTEASYPYASGNGSSLACDANGTGRVKADIKATGHAFLNKSEAYMAAFVAKYGPVSIGLDDMPQLWFPYNGGIMTGCCDKVATHAVLIVGFGVEKGQKYWLIKNSCECHLRWWLALDIAGTDCVGAAQGARHGARPAT